MPIDITDLIQPGRTAVLVNECQQGVIGEHSTLPLLAAESRWILPNVGRLVRAARSAGVDVMHALAGRRPDGRGPRMGTVSRRMNPPQAELTPEQFMEVMPEIGVEPSDFVVVRYGGMGGLSNSGAVSILRGIGVQTLVLAGISLNAAIMSTMIYGLDEGFDVVVVSDACGGFPRSYGEDVLKYSIRVFAPVVTVDEIAEVWARSTAATA